MLGEEFLKDIVDGVDLIDQMIFYHGDSSSNLSTKMVEIS